MSITIREADLGADGESIANALRAYLTPRADQGRFDWLYKRNPHGTVRVWLALNGGGQVVGTAAAFPRRLYIAQEEKTAWVFGDFCVADSYRSLGPALELQKACLAAADNARIPFCYDFPSRGMLAIYQRLGLRPSKQMIRLAKPLRLDGELGKVFRNRYLVKTLAVPANFVLSVLNNKEFTDGTVTFGLHEGRCGEEFSSLAREIGGQYGICVQRSAEYLNWRYLSNPFCRYELLTARRTDNLLGYAVFYEAGQNATPVDLFGINQKDLIRGLIQSLLELLRQRGLMVVSVPIIESHLFRPILEQLGFRVREASPIIVYEPGQSLKPREDLNWFLMHGDRDS